MFLTTLAREVINVGRSQQDAACGAFTESVRKAQEVFVKLFILLCACFSDCAFAVGVRDDDVHYIVW